MRRNDYFYIFLLILILVICIFEIKGSLSTALSNSPCSIYYSNNISEINLNYRKLYNKREMINEKHVYLTFDDGPSVNNTFKILNILKENNVKASFFVVGKKVEENPDLVRKLNKNGMCIMPHTYSHDYKIYKSKDMYMEDLNKCIDVIEKNIGKKNWNYIRIPGGSDNLVSNKYILENIREDIKNRNLYYVDWNVSSGDAEANTVETYKIKNNVLIQCKNKKIAVILMHDGYYKNTTVEALPDIIKYLKKDGFRFKTFDDISADETNVLISMRVINRQ